VDIRQSDGSRTLLCLLNRLRGSIHPDDRPLRPHQARRQEHHVTWAAPYVQHPHPGREPGEVQHMLGEVAEEPGYVDNSVEFVFRMLQGVTGRLTWLDLFHRSSSCTWTARAVQHLARLHL